MQISDLKDLALEDRQAIDRHLQADPPQASELTFTNLFMWRGHYRPAWTEEHGCLVVLARPHDEAPFFFRPVGSGDKAAAMAAALQAMGLAGMDPQISRAEAEFVEQYADPARYAAQAQRDQFDYVYAAEDLINLSGRRYHRKKNHYNKFIKTTQFEYKVMDAEIIEQVLDMQNSWCKMRDCGSDESLIDEDQAIGEALRNFDQLCFQGGAICVQGQVEAFSLGEMLSPDTAVIHIEKANMEVPGLYAAINKLFCENAWSGARWINREQDLGKEGLRDAKESYLPARMVEKFQVRTL